MRDGFSVFLEGMSRKLRFVPEGGALVEVTCRTIHGRLLLRPSQQLDEIVVGILARAQRTFQVRCCGYCFASNHYHLLLDVDSARQLAKFMGYVNSNLVEGKAAVMSQSPFRSPDCCSRRGEPRAVGAQAEQT
jgi:hypothetical protein